MKVPNGMPKCLLLANNGLSDHVAGMSALPPTTDLRVPMSVRYYVMPRARLREVD